MTESAVDRLLGKRRESILWNEESPLTMRIETRLGVLQCRHGRFMGGAADQVEVIEVDTGKVRVMVLPTRGMSIWYMESDGVRFGWDSPVMGPVHPSRVPVFDPSGLGWLEGFDELVVRCGLESNGAPQHDDQGNLVYPLHGRIGNLAADSLSIDYDEASGRLEVIGEVRESRLFFKNFTLRSRLRVHAASGLVELLDDVTNELSKPATMQLLYHINVGAPVLGDGATLEIPLEELAPKDELSASEIDQWNQFGPPQDDYSERVYFAKPRADETTNRTIALLRDAEGERGLAVTFNTNGLPRFVLWKNTAGLRDGYVTGLEPTTNYPNERAYETKQGRVVEIAPEETASFRVSLNPLTTAQAVTEISEKVAAIANSGTTEVHPTPRPGWSPGA
ncbi:MAG: aldose 1-epimerase family protein [Pirellulaceae bacterium]|nr:aldose 1-epimerase family protein [Pirellulaceae bacterium]